MHEQWRIEGRGATSDEQAWIDENAPPFDSQIDLVAGAYRTLQSERLMGMALGPIPFSAVITWAAFYGLSHDNTVFLERTLRVVEYQMSKKQPVPPAKE